MTDTTVLEKPPEQQDGGDSKEPPNKYYYPEFAGYDGERYLDSIVQQILPYALWRTWHYAVDYQAPDSQCYVGTTRLASRVKPGVRKIELDFQELLARGLMRKYADRLPVKQKDGTSRPEAVTVKDFRTLYDLAHEYHVWTHSDAYVPAARDQLDLILGDEHLLAKLLRFDSYRRLIECRKPGRKSQMQAVHLYYRCTRPGDDEGWEDSPEQPAASQQDAQAPGAPGQNANLYSIPPDNTSSPYRESEREEDSLTTVSISSGFGGERVAIRKPTTDAETESKSNPKPANPPQEEEMGGAARAEGVTADNIEQLKHDPHAMAAALVAMYKRGDLGGDAQPAPAMRSLQPKKNQRPRRMPPQALLTTVGKYAQDLGDPQKFVASDITRATKIYFAAAQIFSEFSNGWFRRQLEAAFEAAYKRGIKKRMPYFFTTLENRMEFTAEELAFVRSDEPLYADGNISDFVARLKRQYAKSGSALDYDKWIWQSWLIAGPAQRA